MTHFGIICPAAIGHLNPMCALGRELQRRGHRVTLLGIPDIQSKVLNAGLEFEVIGESTFPMGKLEQIYKQLGEMSGISAMKFTISWIKQEVNMLFDEVPEVIKAAGIEALLVDQITSGGGTIADFLNLPFITICNALLINREVGVPPFFAHWSYGQGAISKLRNQLGNFFINSLTKSVRERIQQQRDQWNLTRYLNLADFYSPLAQICQLPREYDFPRVELSKCFHYTGPLLDPSGLEPISVPSIPFPFEKLTGKPLIYASLGTLQNRKPEIFHNIAQACVGLDAQLVISLGNPNNQKPETDLPGSPLVVSYAPHQQLIQKSSLVITHAGMNTTLGALSSGVPLVAIPITNEQPGIAARIAWSGCGESIPLKKLNVSKLKTAIQKVLTEDSYKQNAVRLQEAIQRAGGVSRAADIIEQAISTRKPVLNV